MTPEKLENQLKESLGRREVRPSADSWEKIAARLDAVQKPARRPRRGWVYLAAAGLLLLLGLRLLLPEAVVPAADEVVTSPVQPETASPAGTGSPTADPDNSGAASPTQLAGENAPSSGVAAELAVSLPAIDSTPGVVAMAPGETLAPIDRDTVGLGARIDASLTSVLEAVAGLEKEQSPVTDAAIDSLLRGAQAAISRRQYGPPRAEVDAMALLSDAEEELDQSFREQIFDKLSTGFDRVRTAVATRND